MLPRHGGRGYKERFYAYPLCCWRSVCQRTPRAGIGEASYEEYDRQMEALLSLIAAKTGLPLYDLREA
jgi:hypothetical protein